MFCPNCGHKVEGVEKFCTQCGAPLEAAAGVKKGGSSRWLKIVGIAGGVVLIIVIVALLLGGETSHSSPEAVVRSCLEAYLERGDAQQILDLWDPQALAEYMRDYELTLDEIREEIQYSMIDPIQQQMEMGLSFSFEIGETTRLNGEALVEVTVIESDPEHGVQEYPQFVSTVERGGRWYLKDLWE